MRGWGGLSDCAPRGPASLSDILSVRCMGWCGRRARCMCRHPGEGRDRGRHPGEGRDRGRHPGEGRDRGRHPEPAFPGISPALPPPTGAGEERRRRGWGGGDRRAVYGEMPVEREIRVAFPRVCAPPGLLPREPPLLRGSPVRGLIRFYLAGRGFPPRAPPRVISPRSGVWGGVGGGYNRVCLPRAGLSGDIACTAPAHGGGGGAPEARVGWGR